MRHRWRARHRALRWGRPPGTGAPGTPIATAEEDFWGPFDARFEFRPNTWQHPGITEPTPSVTVDLAPIFVSKPAEFAAAEGAVNALALLAMTRVFAPTERLLVLDWQHQSWWFRPHQQATREDWQWPVEVFLCQRRLLRVPHRGYERWHLRAPLGKTLCIFGKLAPVLALMLTAWLPIKRSRQ